MSEVRRELEIKHPRDDVAGDVASARRGAVQMEAGIADDPTPLYFCHVENSEEWAITFVYPTKAFVSGAVSSQKVPRLDNLPRQVFAPINIASWTTQLSIPFAIIPANPCVRYPCRAHQSYHPPLRIITLFTLYPIIFPDQPCADQYGRGVMRRKACVTVSAGVSEILPSLQACLHCRPAPES